MGSKHSIKNSNELSIEAPTLELKANNLILGNTPPTLSSNINLLSWDNTNNICGIVDASTVPLQTDIQNIGGFATLVNNPGINTTHNIKTITSSNSSINITSNPSFLNLVTNVSLNNIGTGITVVSNPGTGPSFSIKSILQNTGINVLDNGSDVLIELKPATPEEIGGVFGNQDKFSNHIGFENQIKLPTQSNIIGSILPSGPSVNQSNILLSYPNFQISAGVYNESNIISASAGTEINNSQFTHAIVNNLDASGNDMNNCLYFGNMRNVRPDDESVCINSDLYGSGIRMARGSWYVGAGYTPLSLGNNEMHIDTRCQALYYHNLDSGNGPNILTYDPSSGLISYNSFTNILNPVYGTLRFSFAPSPILAVGSQQITSPGTLVAAGTTPEFSIFPNYGLVYNGNFPAPVEIEFVGFIQGTISRMINLTIVINGSTAINESLVFVSISPSTYHPISLKGIRVLFPTNNVTLFIASDIAGSTVSISGALTCKVIK